MTTEARQLPAGGEIEFIRPVGSRATWWIGSSHRGACSNLFAGGERSLICYLDAQWCEIDDGVDFFAWTQPIDWIISNPPYSITRKCFAHAVKLAVDVVFLVPLRNVFSGYGFVREIRAAGLFQIRLYGTGSRCGFPMGNAIGAVHMRRGFSGDVKFSDQSESTPADRIRSTEVNDAA